MARLFRELGILSREELASIIHERPLDLKESNLMSSCFPNFRELSSTHSS
jgi:hypothetical protein